MSKKPKLAIGEDYDFDKELDAAAAALEEMILGDQPLSEEEKDLMTTIYDRVELFERANKEEHDIARECREILHMRDPNQDSIKTLKDNKKKTLQLQTLKSTINNVVADQMLSMPEAKLLPETPEMQEAADDLQDLVHYVVYCANDFEHTHYRRCEDFYGPGTAVIQVAWDPDMANGKGDIAIIRWPIEAFLWDPMADNIQDCRAVMKLSWHPMSYFRQHWPDTGRYVQADEKKDLGKTEGQMDVEQAGDDERAMLIEYWWRTYNAKTHRYTISVAYAAGHALLEVAKDVYAHGMYPFNIDVHDSKEGSLVGEGLVHELVPMMRYINRYAAYADMNARMSSKGRLLVKRGAGIDADALTNLDNDVIEGDGIMADNIHWLESKPFNGTITQLMTMFQSDLKADSGANQFTRGETTGGIVSGKAINSLIQAGGKVASMRTEQLKYGFKNIIEQVIWLMAQYYKEERVIMITGREPGTRKELRIKPEELFGKKVKGAVNPPPYTVQIEVSSRDPQRIANQNQMFMEAFTMAAQTPNPMRLSDLFKILNLDGKDKILPVIEENEHYQEMMAQMQQQLEQAQMENEQLRADNDNLKSANEDAVNKMMESAARKGGQAPTVSSNEPNPIVDNARNTLGLPTGATLPT